MYRTGTSPSALSDSKSSECSDLEDYLEIQSEGEAPLSVTINNTHPTCDSDNLGLELEMIASPSVKDMNTTWTYSLFTNVPANTQHTIDVSEFVDMGEITCPGDNIADCLAPGFGGRAGAEGPA